MPYGDAVPQIIEPNAICVDPEEQFLTTEEIRQMEVSPEDGHQSQMFTDDDNDSAPVYTYQISDADQGCWTNLYPQGLDTEQMNADNHDIIVEVVEPVEALNNSESCSCASPDFSETTESPEVTKPTTQSTEPEPEPSTTELSIPDPTTTDENVKTEKPRSSFEIKVIEELKRINDKLEQCERCAYCADDEEECDCEYEYEETTEDAGGNAIPVTTDSTHRSERRDKIRRALTALLRTVSALRSNQNNDIIQRFREHNRRNHPLSR